MRQAFGVMASWNTGVMAISDCGLKFFYHQSIDMFWSWHAFFLNQMDFTDSFLIQQVFINTFQLNI
jgi:hypothetical protein